jgi:hypothetical protein
MQILRSEIPESFWRVTDKDGNLVGVLDPDHADLYDLYEVVDELTPQTEYTGIPIKNGYAPDPTKWEGLSYKICPPGMHWDAGKGSIGEYVMHDEETYKTWLDKLFEGKKP